MAILGKRKREASMITCARIGCENPIRNKECKFCSNQCSRASRVKDRGQCQNPECNNPLKRGQTVACSRACSAALGHRNDQHDSELREKVRQLWTDCPEMSASAIGRQVGLTKNAIMGLKNRMGLAPRKTSVPLSPEEKARREKARKEQQPLAGAKAVIMARRVSLKRPKIMAPPPKKEEPPAPIVRFIPRGATCMWVKEEGRGGRDWLFCDAPMERGSYCQKHAKLCYVPRNSVREAA